MSKPFMRVTEDRTEEIMRVINSFRKDEVLVGIPASQGEREDGGISNAALLFINNFGSPINNIPARPVVEIGIRNAQAAIADEFAKAALKALKNGTSAVQNYYERIGMIGSNSIKRAINDQDGIAPISFATALQRLRKGFNGDKALIVTGQMRNAITYVTRGGGGG